MISLPCPHKCHRGTRGCSQFIPYWICFFLLLTLSPCSKVEFHPLYQKIVLYEILQHGYFYRLQFFTDCSSVGPLPGHRSWEKTFCIGFVPQGHDFHQKCAAVCILHGLQLLSLNFLWCRVLHGLQGGYVLHHGPPQAVGESLLWHLKYLFPLLFQWLWCLQSSFITFSPTSPPLLHRGYLSFMLSQRCYHCHWWGKGLVSHEYILEPHWLHWT